MDYVNILFIQAGASLASFVMFYIFSFLRSVLIFNIVSSLTFVVAE
jgi:hypothetical protein